MKVLILYGPPAVGKLTVARELSRLTGYAVLHNHLLLDLSVSLFERGSEQFRQLTRKVRQLALQEGARADLAGMILTFVYARDREAYVSELCQFIERLGTEAYLVHLCCSQATLERRVLGGSRAEFAKITKVATLREKLAVLDDPFGRITSGQGLSLLTDDLAPHETARRIAEHFGLPLLRNS